MVEHTLQEIEEKIRELDKARILLNRIETTCLHCGKKFYGRKCNNPRFQHKYCCQSCRVVESAKRNGRSKKCLRTRNIERYKLLMRKHYHKNKIYWMSRVIIKQHIKNGRVKINKVCKICGTDKEEDKLQIHPEVLPTKIKDIIETVKEEKIYYLCREHRDKLRIKMKQ